MIENPDSETPSFPPNPLQNFTDAPLRFYRKRKRKKKRQKEETNEDGGFSLETVQTRRSDPQNIGDSEKPITVDTYSRLSKSNSRANR